MPHGRTSGPLRSPGALWRRFRRRIYDLRISNSFDVHELECAVEEVRGRRIVTRPLDDPADVAALCGLRIVTADTTIVLYRPGSTPRRTQQAILHELMHEWFGHGTRSPLDEAADRPAARLRDDLLRRFGPGTFVQMTYLPQDEQQAELSASLAERNAHLRPAPGQDLVGLLEHSLSHPVARRRYDEEQRS